jgi:FtsP/CotA-like multicopper oxidase with cupredoxin domain
VRGGLFGALVVHPKAAATAPQSPVEQVAVLHEYDGESTVNGEPGTVAGDAQPGEQVRLRIVNTNNGLAPVWVTGTSFRVLAVDGYDVNEPTDVDGEKVLVPAGGRYDLGFTVPEGGVRVDFAGVTAMSFGGDPTGGDGAADPDDAVDMLSYGTPASLYFDPTQPDREFTYSIGRRPGFLDGRPGRWWSINGHLYPDTPMFMVQQGDIVTMEIENHSGKPHPMHLHGHHAVVLSRDGTPASGSPWWVDSLEVPDGHRFVIAFEADNPGIWMDHCHNLPHAQQGLVSHLMYIGVTSSYRVGGEPGNEPE